jgi:hypothetical protein
MTDNQLIVPSADALAELRDEAEAIIVSDALGEAAAGHLFARCDDALKDIEAKRKEKTAPLNKIVDEINAYAKRLSAPFGEVKDALDAKLSAYRSSEEIRMAEARRNQLSANAKFEAERDMDKALELHAQSQEIAKEVPKTVAVEGGSLRFRDDLIIDEVDMAQLPERYVIRTPDRKLIEADIKNSCDVRGVKYHYEKRPIRYRS